MARFFRFVSIAFILIHFASINIHVYSQTRMLLCESPSQSCKMPGAKLTLAWTFNGTEGVIDSIPGAHLTIDRLDNETIVVSRIDGSGPTAGLSATYAGQVRGKWMDGEVNYSWPGQPGYPKRGTFAAQLQDELGAAPQPRTDSPSGGLPRELLVCEDGGLCNGAWILNGSEGTGTWFDRTSTNATLTVLHFSADDIRIRRTDTTDAISAVYSGWLKDDHYAGTVVWSSPGHPGDSL